MNIIVGWVQSDGCVCVIETRLIITELVMTNRSFKVKLVIVWFKPYACGKYFSCHEKVALVKLFDG